MPVDLRALPLAWQRQGEFCCMQQSFSRHGGLLRRTRPMETPAHDGTLPLAFHWQGAWWIPGFQFEEPGGRVWPGLATLYAELPASHGAWEVACWLALPHPALGGHPPVMLLPAYLDTVRDAARIERYLVSG